MSEIQKVLNLIQGDFFLGFKLVLMLQATNILVELLQPASYSGAAACQRCWGSLTHQVPNVGIISGFSSRILML